ncbi:MAG: DUF6033 family protein [bacterium]|nr:DUF6033 family protein [bacterium]MDY4099594.1 DUF6033 family protein [Lachnospiraceae bacterium]
MGTTVGTSDVSKTAAAAYAESTQKKSKVNGKTIGEPQLSEKGAKYYEQLKAKYGNYDFILVSKEEKANAEANAAQYANKNKTVVLIDEEKIEKMATDSEYRKKYENILSGAQAQIDQLAKSIGNLSGVKGFGIKVNDNGASSFFAAVDKNAAANAKAQQKRLEKKAAEKKEAKKKAQKAADEKRLEKLRDQKRTEQTDDPDEWDQIKNHEDIEVVSAGSIEELVKKVQDLAYASMSDHVMTEAELALGGHIDFKG